jgi:hypothetical protein
MALRRGRRTRAEEQVVAALGDGDHNRFAGTLAREIVGQFLSQVARLHADNAVFARVVTRGARENRDSDVLLGEQFPLAVQRVFGAIGQELPQFHRFAEDAAGQDSADEFIPLRRR